MSSSVFLQHLVNGISLGFIFGLIAIGYTLVYGVVKLVNFAHGDVFMVGAFGFMYAIEKTKHSALGVGVLLAFTFFMGLMLSRLIGTVLARNRPEEPSYPSI